MSSSSLRSNGLKSIIICPSLALPAGARAKVRLRPWGGLWHDAFVFENNKCASFAPVKDPFGHMETDVFVCKKPVSGMEVEVVVHKKARLKSVSAAVIKKGERVSLSSALKQKIKPIALNIKPISQIESGGAEGLRLCSPASLTMILNYFGKKKTLTSVKKAVYDHYSKIYGNWVLNTAYATTLGLDARVQYFKSFAEVRRLLAKNICVAPSIAYKEGALTNAHAPATPGHLVVIKGFDHNGNVITLDPAAKTAAQAQTTYDKKQFACAWLKNKRGVAYVVAKP